MLFVGFTTSCGPLTSPSKNTNSQTSSENLIGGNAQPTASAPLEVPPPVAQPPNYGSRPLKPGETKNATMPNGLPALQPKGVNVGNLFAENISDTNSRFERLENAVTGLRQEFESFKPAIVRLVAVESDIQALIKQLDMLLQNEPTAPPAQLTPQPQAQLHAADQAEPSKAHTPTTQPAAVSSGSFVKAIRTGKHSNKLRLVLDASRQTPFTADLDNQENLLVIELPEAAWNPSRQKNYPGSSLIQSYSVESINGGKGSRVVLTLKKSTQLLKQQALPPGNNPNYRIFLDLKL